MRTLFLNGKKTKQQIWRRLLWIGLVPALLLALGAVMDSATGWVFSAAGMIAVAVFVGVAVVLLVQWDHRRRLQNTAQELKDSALW